MESFEQGMRRLNPDTYDQGIARRVPLTRQAVQFLEEAIQNGEVDGIKIEVFHKGQPATIEDVKGIPIHTRDYNQGESQPMIEVEDHERIPLAKFDQ